MAMMICDNCGRDKRNDKCEHCGFVGVVEEVVGAVEKKVRKVGKKVTDAAKQGAEGLGDAVGESMTER